MKATDPSPALLPSQVVHVTYRIIGALPNSVRPTSDRHIPVAGADGYVHLGSLSAPDCCSPQAELSPCARGSIPASTGCAPAAGFRIHALSDGQSPRIAWVYLHCCTSDFTRPRQRNALPDNPPCRDGRLHTQSGPFCRSITRQRRLLFSLRLSQ